MWNLTLGCAWFSKRIYMYMIVTWMVGVVGHRPNLRRVVIGWTMTFKNITFNTCLRFPRIRISSLCHMWPGKCFGYISISEWRVERTTFQYKNEYFSLILDCICSQTPSGTSKLDRTFLFYFHVIMQCCFVPPFCHC
jgi:hypothetical protein